MPCCKPRNAYRTFNQSCEEREEVNLEHSSVQEILDLKEMVKKAIHKVMGNLMGSMRLFPLLARPKSQPSSWSLVSKMMQSKTVACEEETEV
ncbi:hypothetical protein Pyn_25740 [Prunus yedoensis var. nudiflora]|uniref:Uncharacterized protein n=1 Tax=Prunus yedoensis var. nudiflora TaxID=2094558 RepID=A0A314UMS0_PRUYE|nr:hypothetical protein Pyn_25740 [Prunus yedoensis var. nudiflora]